MYIYLYIHIFLSFVCFSLLGLWTSLSELKFYVCIAVLLNMHVKNVQQESIQNEKLLTLIQPWQYFGTEMVQTSRT